MTIVVVRNLQPTDLDAVIAIDAAAVGRRRESFLTLKLKQAFADTGITVSLVAELDDHVVGFLLARVYYGEFGVIEPVAVLDVLDVHPDYRGRHVAAALLDQLRTNLLGLGIRTLSDRGGLGQPRAARPSSSTRDSRSRRGCASISTWRAPGREPA